MPSRFSATLLRRLRNEIPIDALIRDHLQIPSKISEGIFRFLCPLCSDFHTATNPATNLARCFRCGRNFNPIDMLITVEHVRFRDAVAILRSMLPVYGQNLPAKQWEATQHGDSGHGHSGGVKYSETRRVNY